MLLSDVCLPVCLSHTSGLSREQRRLGRPKLAHVTRTPLSRSKGQGHQADLLSATLTRKAASAVSVGTYIERGKVLLRCVTISMVA